MSQKNIWSVLAVLLTYFALRYLREACEWLLSFNGTWEGLGETGQTVIIIYSKIILLPVMAYVIFRTSPFSLLKMDKDLTRAAGFGILCTLPMFIGYGWQTGFRSDLSFHLLHRDLILAGFFEEFLFRGFLFGMLFYRGGLGFITANIIPSLFFGLGHLYQADDLSGAVGIFIFTALANVGFAWFYVAWNNLWFVVFLHGCMDLAWDMFQVQGNVTGNLYANVFRILTLLLAIYCSVRYSGSYWKTLLKNRLWINREATH